MLVVSVYENTDGSSSGLKDEHGSNIALPVDVKE